MGTQKIHFPDGQTLCFFPTERSNLAQAISELHFKERYPVMVLIGGEIDEQQAEVTRRAIQTISRIAEDMNAVVVCGGTDMGVMAEIGQIRSRNGYKFPLVGVTPEELVAWPGSQFGDESPWIVDTATLLSKGHRSVTILINGGEVSRKDIELSLQNGRPVIALSRTGRLADELAMEPGRHKLVTVVPANAEQRIVASIQSAISMTEKNYVPRFNLREKVTSGTYVSQ